MLPEGSQLQGRRRHVGFSRHTEDGVGNELAERAIAFELRLGEELIRRGLVWEGRVGEGVAAHVKRLGAVVVEAWLDVQQIAWLVARALELGVVDASQRAVQR